MGYAQTFVPFVFLIFGIFFGLLASMIEFVFGYFLNPKNSITHTPVTKLESPTESNLIKDYIDDCYYILQKTRMNYKDNPEKFLNVLKRVHKILDE